MYSVTEATPIPHPEWENLRATRDALLVEMAATVVELHAMEDSRIVILGRYAAAFGDRLVRLGAIEIEAARLKRETELVQAALNAGEDVDFDAIEETLREEFAEWQVKLMDQARQLADHREVLAHLLDPAEAECIRKIFRILVRRLHPDLHPDPSAQDAEMWHRVLAAYEGNDLDELNALELITRVAAVDPPAGDGDAIAMLLDEIATRRMQLRRLLDRLSAMRSQWPFDQLPVLDDEGAVATRQAELDGRIAEATALRDARKRWLDGLLGN